MAGRDKGREGGSNDVTEGASRSGGRERVLREG